MRRKRQTVQGLSVPILGTPYQLEFTELDDCDGRCSPYERRIEVDSRLKAYPSILKRVLWHEIGHAFAFEGGLHESLNEDAIEQFCQTFSALVCQLTDGKLTQRK